MTPLDPRSIVVLASESQRGAASILEACLGALHRRTLFGARQHVPREDVARLVDRLAADDADVVVALGGGSTIGLAKAAALERQVSLVAIPTTYSGSEMTAIWGLTDGGAKATGRSDRARPCLVIYDPSLTTALPVGTSVPSLFNAMAHSVEALYAPGVLREVEERAEESVRVIAMALPQIVRAPTDPAPRSEALYGAHLAGWALDEATMGLHHKLCHVLGGSFGLPHAETHTVLLAHVIAFNRAAAPRAMERLGRALGATDPAAFVHALVTGAFATPSLRALGMSRGDVSRAAALALEGAYTNPRRPEIGDVTQLLERAFAGDAPAH